MTMEPRSGPAPLLLPLVAMSATAYAGSTITDENYWPSEATQSAQSRNALPQSNLNSAFAYDGTPASMQPATNPNDAGPAWRYQGGPKSR